MRKQQQNQETIFLQEAYTNLYNEITQPDRVFVATQYFRKKWVPLLGHALAWLIIALRQHCYWNKQKLEKRDWCLITQEELAEETGMDARTIRRLLKQEYASRFIMEVSNRYRYDGHLRRQVRKESFYRLRMDDPLAPEDEALLRERIAVELSGYGLDDDTGQSHMLHLLDRMLDAGLPEPPPAESPLPQVLPDKVTASKTLLKDNLSLSNSRLEDILSLSEAVLEDKKSSIHSGQNVLNKHNTNKVPACFVVPKENQQQQYSHGGAVISIKKLKDVQLKENEILLPMPESNKPNQPPVFRLESLENIVRKDLLACGVAYDLLPQELETEVYYSPEHALGVGGTEWTEEEQQKMLKRENLEKELGQRYHRLGGFSLEEALHRYFTKDVCRKLLTERTAEQAARVEAWVAYTRQAKNLTNPAGFLRRKIESGEYPPAF
jgi:hypothetical protein